MPTLIHDGEVHIESNDILLLLDNRFPKVRLIPPGEEYRMVDLLRHEDDLHLDLRTLTFRYTQPRGEEPRSKETLRHYRERGSGTVGGRPDSHKDRELAFWNIIADVGITDEAVRTSAGRFNMALDQLNDHLQDAHYLMGETLSVLDIAWVIYINRLVRCGYPMKALHPGVDEWFWPLRNRPEFDREMQVPPDVQKAVDDNHARQRAEGTMLADVMGI